MNTLYRKNELTFSILWIVLYVLSFSISDSLSLSLGTEKSITVITGAVLSAVLFIWMKKNGLLKKYGLCKSEISPGKLLFYIPLLMMISVNFIFGLEKTDNILQTVLYIMSMFFVGFLEEIIFRGLLFRAMCKDNIKSAIIVSSVTFGIGHIVNLFNGNSESLLSSVLQVLYVVAAGFLFTLIFYRTGSLVACIVTHCIFNSLSAFSPEYTTTQQIISCVLLIVIPLVYSVYILRIKTDKKDC